MLTILIYFRYKGTVIGSRYWRGNVTIWLDNVQCVGTETSIANYTHRGWGVHNNVTILKTS